MAQGYYIPIGPFFNAINDNLQLGNGYKIYVYQAGTTTPQTTYTDSTLTTPNANPLVCLSNGRPPNGLWVAAGVKVKLQLTDQFGGTGLTTPAYIDQLPGINDPTSLVANATSYFGGNDTGSANAYAIAPSVPWTSLSNGIQITFYAANTNTGGSTLNVNPNGSGYLGATSIYNQGGAALHAGQIQAGQFTTVVYYSGAWYLVNNSIQVTTFTGTLTGYASPLTPTVTATIMGRMVNLSISSGNSTSNATTFTMTGLPAALQPQNSACVTVVPMEDNSVGILAFANLAVGSGTITFGAGVANNPNGFTASGLKGFTAYVNILYPLT